MSLVFTHKACDLQLKPFTHASWALLSSQPACRAAMFVTASLVNSMLRNWRESFDEKLRQLRILQDRMAASTSYAEWREFAQQVRQCTMASSCPTKLRHGSSSIRVIRVLQLQTNHAHQLYHL